MYSRKAERLVDELIECAKQDALKGSFELEMRDDAEQGLKDAKYNLLSFIEKIEGGRSRAR